MREEIGERRVNWLFEGEQRHSAFQLLKNRGVLLTTLGQLVGCEPQRLVNPALTNELYELLLLQVEEEVSVIIKQFRM